MAEAMWTGPIISAAYSIAVKSMCATLPGDLAAKLVAAWLLQVQHEGRFVLGANFHSLISLIRTHVPQEPS